MCGLLLERGNVVDAVERMVDRKLLLGDVWLISFHQRP